MFNTTDIIAEIAASLSNLGTFTPAAAAEIEAAADALDALADALSPPVTRFTPVRRVTWDADQSDTGAVVSMSVPGDLGCIGFSRDDATGIWTLDNADYGTPLGIAGALLPLVNAVLTEVGG